MNFEFATDYLCSKFLGRLRPSTSGVVLEIGLGSLNYSFMWAAPLGFRCVAVEPLPVEALINSSNEHGVELVRAAMSDISGDIPIFHGELYGHDLVDISSLNPRWWGVGDRKTIVQCLTLPELCSTRSIDLIALMKIDTEGSENNILSMLRDFSFTSLPRIITVEYGGGGEASSCMRGGWAPEFFEGTRQLLNTLEELGYNCSIVLEENRILPKLRKSATAFDAEKIFESDFVVGNLLFIRDAKDAVMFDNLIRSSIHVFVLSSLKLHCVPRIRWLRNWHIRIMRKLAGFRNA